MLENDEHYLAVVAYLSGEKDTRSAQDILWELSHCEENGMFFVSLDFADFKTALDSIKISGGRYE